MLQKTFLVLIALVATSSLTLAQSRQVVGTAGYLSEWEITGTVTETISAGRTEFFGPLVWKHLYLCSPNESPEKRGEIRFRIQKSSSRIDATMALESVQCTYTGNFSDKMTGYLDCPDAKGVPLSLSIR